MDSPCQAPGELPHAPLMGSPWQLRWTREMEEVEEAAALWNPVRLPCELPWVAPPDLQGMYLPTAGRTRCRGGEGVRQTRGSGALARRRQGRWGSRGRREVCSERASWGVGCGSALEVGSGAVAATAGWLWEAIRGNATARRR